VAVPSNREFAVGDRNGLGDFTIAVAAASVDTFHFATWTPFHVVPLCEHDLDVVLAVWNFELPIDWLVC